MTLMRFDPFREFDRWAEQALSSQRKVQIGASGTEREPVGAGGA